MKLPQPNKKDSKVVHTLYHLIMNRRLTSVEIAKLTRVGYPPRKVQLLEQKGLMFIHDLVPYTTKEGVKTNIARYTLTDINQARKIYKKLVA